MDCLVLLKLKLNRCLRTSLINAEEEQEERQICIARRREYTSNALSSLKLGREAVQDRSLPTACVHRLRAATPNNRPQAAPASSSPSLSFNRPRRDGWLSWPCWLTVNGRFTNKVVKRPATSLVQDRESSSARTGGLTTMLRYQLKTER